jgi:hypothetical protein
MTYHAPLETPVAFNGPNEPIRLASETAQLFQGSTLLLEGKTDVDFRWAPYPAVALTIAAPAGALAPETFSQAGIAVELMGAAGYFSRLAGLLRGLAVPGGEPNA